jgi:hemerythrin superfamily protein
MNCTYRCLACILLVVQRSGGAAPARFGHPTAFQNPALKPIGKPRRCAKPLSRPLLSSARSIMTKAKEAKHDAIELLLEDHKQVQKLFKAFKKAKDDEETKQDLVETACTALTIHAQIEEEIFYPAAREVIEQDLLNEAEVEHNTAKNLITQLEEMEPEDELYEATFTVLGEYVNHHIEEEQEQIFPKVKKAKLDLNALGEELSQRKRELEEDMGVAEESETSETARDDTKD